MTGVTRVDGRVQSPGRETVRRDPHVVAGRVCVVAPTVQTRLACSQPRPTHTVMPRESCIPRGTPRVRYADRPMRAPAVGVTARWLPAERLAFSVKRVAGRSSRARHRDEPKRTV